MITLLQETEAKVQVRDARVSASGSSAEPDIRAGLPSVAVSHAVSGWVAQAFDLCALTAALLSTPGLHLFAATAGATPALDRQISIRSFVLLCALWVGWAICLRAASVYRTARRHLFGQMWVGLAIGAALSAGLVAVLPFFWGSVSSLQTAFDFWVAATALLLLGRGVLLLYARSVKPRLRERRQTLIVGTGPRAQQLAAELPLHADIAYELIGFIDSEPQPGIGASEAATIGSLDDLEAILMDEQIDDVFIALPMRSNYEGIERVLAMCERTGVQSHYLADLFRTSITKRSVAEGDDASRIMLQMVHHDHRRFLKRGLDLAGAAVGLVLLAPVFAIVALLIRLTSPGPVLFRQTRYGLNKRKFSMYKFRSMVVDAETRQAALEHLNESGGPVFKIRHDPRITPIGRFMRKTSIDELPQLFNVLLGEMSLVGPRPLPMRDVSRFDALDLMRRFSVKPGMTGLWQVSGRSNTSFTGWISLDLHYIDHWSLSLDVRILLRTFSVVMRGTGAA